MTKFLGVACIKDCLENSINYCNKAVETNPEAFEKDDWIQALPGFANYYLADLYNEKYEDIDKAMVKYHIINNHI